VNLSPTQHRSSEFQRRFGRYETFPPALKKYRASGTTAYLATFNCQYYTDLDDLPQRQSHVGQMARRRIDDGARRSSYRKEDNVDTSTLLIIILLVLLIGGGGWYGRGRWY
jgi:hypothetical protein